MRLGDLDAFKEQWNEDSYIGKLMRKAINELPTIDPENLPIVQKLRAKIFIQETNICELHNSLERVTSQLNNLKSLLDYKKPSK